MQVKLSKKARAKTLYDSGKISVVDISREADVTEEQFLISCSFKKGESH